MIADTSLEAYGRTDAVGRNREILTLFQLNRGLTADEIARIMGIPHHWVSPRVVDLRDKFKLIYDTGKRRNTKSGRAAKVYDYLGHMCNT